MSTPTKLSRGSDGPAKGSFPLDHDGECKEAMLAYLNCVKSSKMSGTKCRHESLEYLKCRMNNQLMMDEPMNELGFEDLES